MIIKRDYFIGLLVVRKMTRRLSIDIRLVIF